MAQNPVIPGFSPDPSVCRVGDLYYLVTSTFEYFPAIALYRSSNLTDWTLIGSVLDREGQLDLSGVPDSGGIFAPTIRHHDGVWYVVCTLVGSPSGGSFVVSSDDPEGPWGEPVWVPEAHGIDPSLLFDGDRVWWTATDRAAGPAGERGACEIWLRELDLSTMQLTGPERVIWRGAMRDALWVEAPHLYRVGDWYYLVTAEGGTELNHAVVVARSTAVTGPYENNPANPILTHRHLGEASPFSSMGHADLVQDPGGSWWAVCLGTRREEGHHLLGRETFLAVVTWEQGWPVVNAGCGRVTETVVGPAASTGERSASHFQDFRECAALGPEWLSLRSAPACEPAADGLVLRNGLLGVRLRHHDAELELVARPEVSDGGTVGLLLRQSSRFQVRVQLGAQSDVLSAAVVCRRDGLDLLDSVVILGSVPRRVRLRAVLRGLELTLVLEGDGRELLSASVDARDLSTETAGGFVGTVAGPFVEGGGQLVLETFSYRA